jgi:hypothetical protein
MTLAALGLGLLVGFICGVFFGARPLDDDWNG